jgi:hypothetical protein
MRLTAQASVLELADQDALIAAQFVDLFDQSGDRTKAQLFSADSSRRVAMSGRIIIEQSDLLIAIWDGVSTAAVGGTGHTIAAALDSGTPVIRIDPVRPDGWQVLRTPESLLQNPPPEAQPELALATLLDSLFPEAAPFIAKSSAAGQPSRPIPPDEAIAAERWHARSNPASHAYRRIERLFGMDGMARLGSVSQRYEHPDGVETGSAAPLLAAFRGLPGVEPSYVESLLPGVFRRFAWMDGISARLSDSYRGGMIVNFLLSFLAIVGGTAYLPFLTSDSKWPFACSSSSCF